MFNDYDIAELYRTLNSLNKTIDRLVDDQRRDTKEISKHLENVEISLEETRANLDYIQYRLR